MKVSDYDELADEGYYVPDVGPDGSFIDVSREVPRWLRRYDETHVEVEKGTHPMGYETLVVRELHYKGSMTQEMLVDFLAAFSRYTYIQMIEGDPNMNFVHIRAQIPHGWD